MALMGDIGGSITKGSVTRTGTSGLRGEEMFGVAYDGHIIKRFMIFAGKYRKVLSIAMIAVMLIVFGLLLLVADRRPQRRSLDGFTLRDALLMGVGQAFALQPGVSRSGATLTVSRFLEFNRDAAARLVFLMSLPVIAGAGIFSLADADIPSDFWPPFLWGMAASAVTGTSGRFGRAFTSTMPPMISAVPASSSGCRRSSRMRKPRMTATIGNAYAMSDARVAPQRAMSAK